MRLRLLNKKILLNLCLQQKLRKLLTKSLKLLLELCFHQNTPTLMLQKSSLTSDKTEFFDFLGFLDQESFLVFRRSGEASAENLRRNVKIAIEETLLNQQAILMSRENVMGSISNMLRFRQKIKSCQMMKKSY